MSYISTCLFRSDFPLGFGACTHSNSLCFIKQVERNVFENRGCITRYCEANVGEGLAHLVLRFIEEKRALEDFLQLAANRRGIG